MPDYNALADTALRLIKDAGLVVPVSRKAADNYDPVAGEVANPSAPATWDVAAAVFPATLARFKGIDNKYAEDSKGLVLSKARYLLVAGNKPDGTPAPEFTPDDRMSFHDKTWRVVGATPFKPQNKIIYFQVGVVLES